MRPLPMGPPVGIPGAPSAPPVSAGRPSLWPLCAPVARAASPSPVVPPAVLALPLALAASLAPLPSPAAVLVSSPG
ncbi:type VII secretion protein EccB, partial [Mycobacterium tuberculosis]|uniref:type VII secretion protein EccB n=1 Tax=Mycobacterium tuberculosis TaxID=1773 RepID=UPI00234FFE1E